MGSRCRAELDAKEATIQSLKSSHEKILAAIFRQLFDLEVGLRRKEKELTTALLQREKVIREQSYLIKVLGAKVGAKRADIRQLCDEAKAKIPQVESIETTMTTTSTRAVDGRKNVSLSNIELTSIVESCSENDSDSAIMVDDERLLQQSSPEMSTTTLPRMRRKTSHRHAKSISRSVSDVVSAVLSPDSSSHHDDIVDDDRGDYNANTGLGHAFSTPHICSNDAFVDDDDDNDEMFNGFDSAHYRGFLLRHGSYERYKIRTKTKESVFRPEISGVCTLPRTKTNDKTGVHLHVGSSHSSDALKHRRVVPASQPTSQSTSQPTTIETKTCGKNSTTVVMINTDQVAGNFITPCPYHFTDSLLHRYIAESFVSGLPITIPNND